MKASVEEGSLVPHRLRVRPRPLRAAELGPLRERAPHRRVRAQQGRIPAVEHGRIDRARGVAPRNERDPSLGLSRGGSPAPLPVLRTPAAAAMRRFAPHRTATGRVPAQQARELERSRRARHVVSAGRETRPGHDRRPAVLQDARQVGLQALRPVMEPIVPRLPTGLTGLTQWALAKRRASNDAADLLRGVGGRAVPGLPDSGLPGPATQVQTNPGLARDARSRDHPGPSQARDQAQWPPATFYGWSWAGYPPKTKSQGTRQ